MYIYKLLVIFMLTTVEGRGVWDLFEEFMAPVTPSVPEDARLNIEQLARKYGYNLDEHTATTKDGYIINFHRIYFENIKTDSPIVFLMHGILESSDSWLLQGRNNSLAYLLADEGYDVWMGNARGNRHSTEHTTLNNTSSEYWQFTWEQIGIYDLSAMIDYILEETGKDSLYYTGHSQGTTIGYVLLSMKPQYNQKIKLMFSLAPEAWMGHVESPIIRFFSSTFYLYGSVLIYVNTLPVGMDFYTKISSFLCSTYLNCDSIMYGLSGHGGNVNKTLLPIIFGHMPTGSSVLQFIHYGQLVNSQRFCRYDYGYDGNMKEYNQAEPPDYDLSKIVTPNVLFYSDTDWLSDQRDVDTLKNRLPCVLAYIYLSNFTHMDYVYSIDAREAIYMKIIAKIKKFEKNYYANHMPK